MELTVSMQVTLDGVAQANGGNNEEMDPGFTRGGWATALGDAECASFILDTWRRPDAFLLGRETFELFETYWGPRRDDGGFGEASVQNRSTSYRTLSPTRPGSTQP